MKRKSAKTTAKGRGVPLGSEKLTKKQAAFASAYVRMGNASQAYRSVYRSKAKPENVWSEASRLLSHPQVAARVDGLRREISYRHLQTFDSFLTSLDRVIADARTAGRFHSAIQGLSLKARVMGWDKPEPTQATADVPVDLGDLSSSDLDALEAILMRQERGGKPTSH